SLLNVRALTCDILSNYYFCLPSNNTRKKPIYACCPLAKDRGGLKRGLMLRKSIIGLIIVLNLGACSYFRSDETVDAVARVGDSYLYKKDLSGIYGENMSREDSLVVKNNFVNNWAMRQLFMEKAKINLPEEQLREFEKLIEEYKTDLYTTTYKEALVNSAMDTAVTDAEV